MIRYIYGDQLDRHPELGASMFQDRAVQLKSRLKWDVTVDKSGQERDEYDAENPLYVIWQMADGHHGGSMRFLPTTGPTMVNDHFADLAGGAIISPLIWECTRFCISQKADRGLAVSAALMLAGALLGQQSHLKHAIGVFDAHMVRVYRKLGWCPDILGTKGVGSAAISVGLWDFETAPKENLARRASVHEADWSFWLKTLG